MLSYHQTPDNFLLDDPDNLFDALKKENQKKWAALLRCFQEPALLEGWDKNTLTLIKESMKQGILQNNSDLVRSARRFYQSKPSTTLYRKAIKFFLNLHSDSEALLKAKHFEYHTMDEASSQLQYLAYSPKVIRQLLEALPALEEYLHFASDEFKLKKKEFQKQKEYEIFIQKYETSLKKAWEDYFILQKNLSEAAWVRLNDIHHQKDVTAGDPLQSLAQAFMRAYPHSTESKVFKKAAGSDARFWMAPNDFLFFNNYLEKIPRYEEKLKECFWHRIKNENENFKEVFLNQKSQLAPTSLRPLLTPPSSIWEKIKRWLNPYEGAFQAFITQSQGLFMLLRAFPSLHAVANIPVGEMHDARLQYLLSIQKELQTLEKNFNTHFEKSSGWFATLLFGHSRETIKKEMDNFISREREKVLTLKLHCLASWLDTLEGIYRTRELLRQDEKKKPICHTLAQEGLHALMNSLNSSLAAVSLSVKEKFKEMDDRWKKLKERDESLQNWHEEKTNVEKKLSALARGDRISKALNGLIIKHLSTLTQVETKKFKEQNHLFSILILDRFLNRLEKITSETISLCEEDFELLQQEADFLSALGDTKILSARKKGLQALIFNYYERASFTEDPQDKWFLKVENFFSHLADSEAVQNNFKSLQEKRILKKYGNNKEGNNKAVGDNKILTTTPSPFKETSLRYCLKWQQKVATTELPEDIEKFNQYILKRLTEHLKFNEEEVNRFSQCMDEALDKAKKITYFSNLNSRLEALEDALGKGKPSVSYDVGAMNFEEHIDRIVNHRPLKKEARHEVCQLLQTAFNVHHIAATIAVDNIVPTFKKLGCFAQSLSLSLFKPPSSQTLLENIQSESKNFIHCI